MPPDASRLTRIYGGAVAACVGLISVSAANPGAWGVLVASSLLATLLGFLAWRRGEVGYGFVIGMAILFRLALLWLPPVLSDDPYRYVWDGLLQMRGINPYLHVPESEALASLHAEPIYQELNSAGYYTVYPPLSQLFFRFGALFYGGGWESSYYVIKALIVSLEIGAVFLLARLVSAPALILYAWNPLVLLAGAGQGHGEAALVFFLAATWYLAERKRGGWASIFLACAGLIKLYPFVFYPFLWRRFGWRSVWPGILAAAALALPYVDREAPQNVLQSLDLYVRLFEFNAGPYYFLKEIFLAVTGEDWSKQLGPFLRWVFLATLPVLYYLDWRRGWSLQGAILASVGAFLLLSTTVHPWYLVPVLLLGATKPSWHWYWLGSLSLGTYLLYAGGPYWIWVIVGWSGFFVLAIAGRRHDIVQALLRLRARGKAKLIGRHIGASPLPIRILDLGAGEGYVAEALTGALEGRTEAVFRLTDVADMNRTGLSYSVFDGEVLPFDDDEFDVTVICYVLHHAKKPQVLVKEAARVTQGRIIVIESTYRHEWERRLLELVDIFANRLRMGGRTDSMEMHLNFRTFDVWRSAFQHLGLREAEARDLGGFVHRRALFVLEKPMQAQSSNDSKTSETSFSAG